MSIPTDDAGDSLIDLDFTAEVVVWRGPAPFFFAPAPAPAAQAIAAVARAASYGWGCIPVRASANGVAFTTSLFPREGGYLLPLKAAVRRAAQVTAGDAVQIRLSVAAPRR